ncbi:MAG: hypothetical protein ACR2OV_00210 [Hyphomicrobiaceae bacterium]
MRLWLLVPGSVLLIVGILMMFSVAFGFVLGAFHSGGRVAVTVWHVVLPLVPTLVGLLMVYIAPSTKPTDVLPSSRPRNQ